MDDASLWSAPRWIYPCLCVIVWIALCFQLVRKARLPPMFQEFQDKFFNAYFVSLYSYCLQSAYVQQLSASRGLGGERMGTVFSLGHAAELLLGTPMVLSADQIGRKRISFSFAILQLFAAAALQLHYQSTLYLAQICNGVSGSILACVFVSWMISEHEKLGFPHEWLGETFWMMFLGGGFVALTTTAAVSVLGNELHWTLDALCLGTAALSAILISRWTENAGDLQGRQLMKGFRSSLELFRDRNIATLGVLQVTLDVSLSVFWMLWIPTLVADGRDIHTGTTYSLFMVSYLLGSGSSSLLLSGTPICSLESVLPPVLVTVAGCFSVKAYDYQEVGVLVASMCVFHFCAGLVAPSLARLQSSWIPSSHRAGVMAISQVPSKIILIFFLIMGARLHILENSSILWFCALINMVAAGWLYVVTHSAPDKEHKERIPL